MEDSISWISVKQGSINEERKQGERELAHNSCIGIC